MIGYAFSPSQTRCRARCRGRPSTVHRVDPVAGQVGQRGHVGRRCKPLRLEAAHSDLARPHSPARPCHRQPSESQDRDADVRHRSRFRRPVTDADPPVHLEFGSFVAPQMPLVAKSLRVWLAELVLSSCSASFIHSNDVSILVKRPLV